MQPGGRGVGATQTRPVAPGPFYIGLRPATDGAVRIDNPETIAVALVAPDGSAFSARSSGRTPCCSTYVRRERWQRKC